MNYEFDITKWEDRHLFDFNLLVQKYKPWFIGSNLMYEQRCMVFKCSLPTTCVYPFDDIFLISYLWDQSKIGNGEKAQILLHYYTKDWGEDVHDQLWKVGTPNSLLKKYGDEAIYYYDRDDLITYCSTDSYGALRLFRDFFQARIEKIQQPYELLKRAMFAYIDIEKQGIGINTETIERLYEEYGTRIRNMQYLVDKDPIAA